MKTISTDEIKSHLTKLFWDIKVNPDELFHLFIGKIDKIGPIDRATFYSRILTSFDWYTILKVVPRKDLKALLDDDILNRIYPKGLKEKYLYARRIIGTTSDTFLRVFIEKDGIRMKVDFINDVPFHFGDFTQFEKFNRVDNWRNILSNKLCALSRHEPKDVVDILFIAKKYHFEWEEIFQEAKEKDLWVEPIEISKIIKGFKPELFRSINWVNPINFSELADSLDKLYKDVFYGNTNSLNSELI